MRVLSTVLLVLLLKSAPCWAQADQQNEEQAKPLSSMEVTSRASSQKTTETAKPLSWMEVTFPTPQIEEWNEAFKARLRATSKLKLRLYYFNSFTNQFNPDAATRAKVKEIRAYVKKILKGEIPANPQETPAPPRRLSHQLSNHPLRIHPLSNRPLMKRRLKKHRLSSHRLMKRRMSDPGRCPAC